MGSCVLTRIGDRRGALVLCEELEPDESSPRLAANDDDLLLSGAGSASGIISTGKRTLVVGGEGSGVGGRDGERTISGDTGLARGDEREARNGDESEGKGTDERSSLIADRDAGPGSGYESGSYDGGSTGAETTIIAANGGLGRDGSSEFLSLTASRSQRSKRSCHRVTKSHDQEIRAVVVAEVNCADLSTCSRCFTGNRSCLCNGDKSDKQTSSSCAAPSEL